MRISSVREQEVVVERLGVNEDKKLPIHMLMGDILIELMNDSWMNKRVSRINFNIYFMGENTEITFKSNNIKI